MRRYTGKSIHSGTFGLTATNRPFLLLPVGLDLEDFLERKARRVNCTIDATCLYVQHFGWRRL